jgi:hypothetical protein
MKHTWRSVNQPFPFAVEIPDADGCAVRRIKVTFCAWEDSRPRMSVEAASSRCAGPALSDLPLTVGDLDDVLRQQTMS